MTIYVIEKLSNTAAKNIPLFNSYQYENEEIAKARFEDMQYEAIEDTTTLFKFKCIEKIENKNGFIHYMKITNQEKGQKFKYIILKFYENYL